MPVPADSLLFPFSVFLFLFSVYSTQVHSPLDSFGYLELFLPYLELLIILEVALQTNPQVCHLEGASRSHQVDNGDEPSHLGHCGN